MASYDDKFNQAFSYLSRPDITNPTGDKPICYVTYDVRDAIDMKRIIKETLIPKAKYYGFEVKLFSIGQRILEYLNNYPDKDELLDDSYSEDEIFESLAVETQETKWMEKAILDFQEQVKSAEHPLIVVTDLEMLHPLYKMGLIENTIYNKITVPMLVLYPGEAQGFAKRFLNFYKLDGNYRSKNF